MEELQEKDLRRRGLLPRYTTNDLDGLMHEAVYSIDNSRDIGSLALSVRDMLKKFGLRS